MPGAELTEVVDDKTYKGKIAVRLGPVALTFAGLVTFEEIDNANRTARVRAQGTDAKGRGSAQGDGDVPRRGAVGRRLEGAGAHRSHAVGRGRAIRPRRRHDPGDRRGDHESVRQQPESEDCARGCCDACATGAGTSATAVFRVASRATTGGQADLRLFADGESAVGVDPEAVRPQPVLT